MDLWIQWGITTVIAIFGLLAGRYWGLHDRLRNHDMEVLKEILKTIPSDGTINFIRQHDFGDSFDLEETKELYDFIYLAERVEYQFVDSKLERMRLKLNEDVKVFNNYLSQHTWLISSNGSRRCKMKDEEDFISDAAYHTVRNRINGLADQVCQSYDSLIGTAIKKGL